MPATRPVIAAQVPLSRGSCLNKQGSPGNWRRNGATIPALIPPWSGRHALSALDPGSVLANSTASSFAMLLSGHGDPRAQRPVATDAMASSRPHGGLELAVPNRMPMRLQSLAS